VRRVTLHEVQGVSSQELPEMLFDSERLLHAFAGRRERLRVNLLRLGKDVAAHGKGATRSWFLQLSLALASHWSGRAAADAAARGTAQSATAAKSAATALHVVWNAMDEMDACALKSSLEQTSPQVSFLLP
jgi:hypothetical protein